MIMGIVNRSITCSNKDGIRITFGERGFSPFLLVDAVGCYAVENNVTISENTMSDGGAYQGSVAKIRNIVLTVRDYLDNVYNRNLLVALFKSGEEGTLVFSEDPNERQINYYVESINSTGNYGSRTYTISLLCPDPFFYAMEDVTLFMSAWIASFEFIHEFIESGEELGYRSLKKLSKVTNENAADNIGMDIVIYANGDVTNPSVTRIESDETITVGTTTKPLVMASGDTVRITTSDNDKHVYLTHEGITTEINQYLTEDSVFIQLMRGENTIGYDADSGVDSMVVQITYRLKYTGA